MDALFECEGIAVALLTEESERAELQALFRSVVAEKGWQEDGDLGGDPARSLCFAAFFAGRLAGGIEVRLPGPDGGLPLFATWPRLGLRCGDHPAELVLLALSPAYRAVPGLLWYLCAEMWRHCARTGISHLLVAVPERNRRVYCRLGWKLETVGPERAHWGEPCFPCRIGIEAVAEEVAARARLAPSLVRVVEQAYRK